MKHMQMSQQPYFEELVNLAQVDPLLGIEFVDITHVPVHQVQTEAHHLTPRETKCYIGTGQMDSKRSGRRATMGG